MEQSTVPLAMSQAGPDIVRTASMRHDAPGGVSRFADLLGPEDLEIVILYVTPEADFHAVISDVSACCQGVPVVGCTTAGEISEHGYTEGEIIAIGLPKAHFRAEALLIEDLDKLDSQSVIDRMIRSRNEMATQRPTWDYEFNFVMIDGLSIMEDALMSELSVGLGPVPLFGGSAGDGEAFEKTYVMYDGRAHTNAAVLVQVRTRCPIQVFKTDHMVPTDQRMVVTGADPARRVVTEINAEPAAREYARVLGKDPDQLTTFTFAAHPLVVRIGGQHHVRSIQRVADNGDLVFFSAIDEGLVLTLADPMDMAEHLEQEMANLRAKDQPAIVLACDCILRRMEAQEKQVQTRLSQIYAENRVVGFSTYGEQLNAMHVNQTLTGVAIYPPRDNE